MPKYSFVVWTKRSRVKYPESFCLPDVEAAHQLATRIARVFGEVVPQCDELTYNQQENFAVEVVDVAGQMVLTVPCKEAEEHAPATRHLNTKKTHQDCSTGGASGEGSRGGNILNLTRLSDRSVRRST